MKRLSIIFILIFSLLISGCWNLLEINDAAVTLGLGVDLMDNGQIKVSTQLAKTLAPQQSIPGEPEVVVHSATGRTITAAARNIALSLPRMPLWAHSGVQIIGEKLARQDMALIMDMLFRNRNVRHNCTMFIATNTTPSEIFAIRSPLVNYSSRGLEKSIIFQEEQLGIYIPVTQTEFFSDLVTSGVEPVVPQVVITEKSGEKQLLINGSAVFKDKRMIGSLNEKESRGYRWLRSRIKNGGIIVVDSPVEPGRFLMFEVQSFKSKSRPLLEGNKIKMKVEIEAEFNFYEENAAVNLLTEKNQEKLEKLAADKIEEEVQACITKAQGLNSDILGWGRTLTRYQPDLWKELKPGWDEFFPLIDSEIQVKTHLRGSRMRIRVFDFKS